MANMTFKTNLLPNSTSGEYSLGSSEQYWNIYGKVNNLNIHYGVCETSAATSAKAVTCDSFSADDLTTGAIVYVTFTNTNSATASNLTLSVNGTTAKPIKYQYNASAASSLPSAGYLITNQTYAFTYNGTNWVTRDIHLNTDTNTYMRTYSNKANVELPIPGVSTSASSASAAWATTSTYRNAYGAYPSTGTPTINPSNGIITVPNGVKTDTILAPTTSNGTTYGIGTSGQALVSNGSAMYWGDVTPPLSNTAAESLGTASAGTSTSVARADHVHPLPSAADVGALPDDTFIPSKTSDLTNDTNFMSGMTILTYNVSTWNDFITAYNAKHLVYCRSAATGSPRMAFMAYIAYSNNEISNVEFQYYRSRQNTNYTTAIQGDQVCVYKLEAPTSSYPNGKWTLTTRNAYVSIQAGTGLSATTSTATIDGATTTKLTLENTLVLPEASTATPQNLGTATTGTSTAYAREDHVHEKPTYGNISTSGAISTTTTISSGDKLAIIDASNNNQLTGSSISFGTSGDYFLNNSGTWSQLATSLEPLTLFGKSYDGTNSLDITIEDLNLTVGNTGMEFKGVVTSNIANGDTTSTLTLTDGTTLSNPQNGWVILDNQNEQFVWSNNQWTAMGVASIYALQNHIHGNLSSGGLLTNTTGTVNSGDYLVIADSVDAKLKKSDLTFSAVSTCANYYLNRQGNWSQPVTSITISGTSGQINVNDNSAVTTTGTRTLSLASGVISSTGNFGLASNTSPSFGSGFYVPYLSIDTYGRVTSAVNNTVTIPDTTATTAVTGLMDSSTYTSAYNAANSYVSAGSGISIDVTDNFGTTSGVRTITNAGVRSITTSGSDLWVDTNGSSTGITIPYADEASMVHAVVSTAKAYLLGTPSPLPTSADPTIQPRVTSSIYTQTGTVLAGQAMLYAPTLESYTYAIAKNYSTTSYDVIIDTDGIGSTDLGDYSIWFSSSDYFDATLNKMQSKSIWAATSSTPTISYTSGTTGQVLRSNGAGRTYWDTIIANNTTSTSTALALSANSGRYLDATKVSLLGGASISSGADLNTTAFLKVGNYTCTSNSKAETLSNMPSGFSEAFMLKTYAPLTVDGNFGDNDLDETWKYRIQEITSMYGTKIWRRFCNTGSTAGEWNYGDWSLITPQYNTYITTTAPTSSSADGIYLVI